MFCENCGKEVENGTKYCSYCGSEVSQASPVNTGNITAPSSTGANKVEITLSGVQQIFSGKIKANTILGCIIGLFMSVGAFLPWITAKMSILGANTSYSAPGTRLQSYGIWVIITGILCAILSFAIPKKIRAWGFLLLGAISAIDILVYIINFNSEVGGLGLYSSLVGGFSISKGIGVWISLIGAIGAIILGMVELRQPSNIKKDVSSIPANTTPKAD
jgi:zinc-ribbon domain